MGLSNSIGSNTFDILLCLGLPWLIKSLAYPTVPGNHWVGLLLFFLSYRVSGSSWISNGLVGFDNIRNIQGEYETMKIEKYNFEHD